MIQQVTITKDFPFELADKIIEYLEKNNISKIKIVLSDEEGASEDTSYIVSRDRKKIRKILIDTILNDGVNFSLLEKNKILFEEFTYGIEVFLIKENFSHFFKEYIKED